MDTRIKLILAGLFIAIAVVIFLIFTGRFSGSRLGLQREAEVSPVQQIEPSEELNLTPTITLTPTPIPGRVVAPTGVLGQTMPNTGVSQTLPNTGFPLALVGIFAASAAISGFFLRKYPD